MTVSPRRSYANEFKKLTITYYLPLWELKDLEVLIKQCEIRLLPEDLKERFEILNGVPGRLFETTLSPQRIVDIALSQSDIGSLMKAPVSYRNVEHVAHVLVLRTTQDFVSFELAYASRYVSQRV